MFSFDQEFLVAQQKLKVAKSGSGWWLIKGANFPITCDKRSAKSRKLFHVSQSN